MYVYYREEGREWVYINKQDNATNDNICTEIKVLHPATRTAVMQAIESSSLQDQKMVSFKGSDDLATKKN